MLNGLEEASFDLSTSFGAHRLQLVFLRVDSSALLTCVADDNGFFQW